MRFSMLMALSALMVWGQKYNGPRPPKPDVPYLVHADTLVPTEAAESKQESSKKNDAVYSIAGTGGSAKTPLAEPIFLMESEKIQPQTLELYRVEVKGGRREVNVVQRKTRGGPKPLRLTVTKLDGRLYRIEADEELENGQYALSPNGSNTVFCFEVY